MCLLDLGCARSAANDGDLAGASSMSPRAPAVLVHDTHVCDTPRSPSTPYDTPTHSTRTLGEQETPNPSLFCVSNMLRASREGDDSGSSIQRSTAPFKSGPSDRWRARSRGAGPWWAGQAHTRRRSGPDLAHLRSPAFFPPFVFFFLRSRK